MSWRLILPALIISGKLFAADRPQLSPDCLASTPYRSFDFWLGKWSVSDASGTVQGENTIRAIQQGCALEEQWTGERGSTGQSINYYHPGLGEWRQIWIDSAARIIDLRGNLREGVMTMEGTIYYPGRGEEKGFRGSWTPLDDGRVRQLFEEESENGEWQVWFEGFYMRIK